MNFLAIFRYLYESFNRKFIYQQLVSMLGAIFEMTSLWSIYQFLNLVTRFDVPQFLGYDLSLIGVNEFSEQVFFWGFLSTFFIAISVGFGLLGQFQIVNIAYNFQKQVSEKIFKSVIKIKYEEFLNLNHVETNSTLISEVQRATSGVIFPILNLGSKLISSCIICFYLLYTDFTSAILVVIIFSAAFFSVYSIIRRVLVNNGIKISVGMAERINIVNEVFRNFKEIKISSNEDLFLRIFKGSIEKISNSQASNIVLSQSPRYVLELIALSSVVVGLTLSSIGNPGELNDLIPKMGVFLLGGLKVLPSANQIYSNFASIKANLNAFEHVKENIRAADVLSERKLLTSLCSSKVDSIEVDHFKYKNTGGHLTHSFIVQGSNFEAKAGDNVLICGPSGSGKSTFMDILMGLRALDEGAVFVNGEPIVNCADYWDRLAYVSQFPVIYNGSLLFNLLTNEGASSQQISECWRVLRLLDLEKPIKSLPKGLDEKISSERPLLSGGQIQRLGIARALLRNADAYFFDEITSSLDEGTSRMVLNSLSEELKEKISIHITHSKSDHRAISRIYLMHAGVLTMLNDKQ